MYKKSNKDNKPNCSCSGSEKVAHEVEKECCEFAEWDEENIKLVDLEFDKVCHEDAKLTTNQGVGISNDQETQKAGARGPALLQDFIFREKVTHFDHERIPERVVHARGTGAHGFFEVYEDMSDLTMADFLSRPNEKTPVFVRFSTVAGFRGSPDTVRDVRGFAVKFYTKEGNYDIVGNNMPVFFIQDAIKFPDLIHALKPEPNNEIPQAQSAHDTFWDFVANNLETAHNVMWLMSDRAIPKSFRTMDGFGINTFKMINKAGKVVFVKFHWKSLQGVHSLVWNEAQGIAGKDPDFNRRDLWENIENGNFPEWELGVQVIPVEDEFKFGFDILDSTKLWPEEIVPVRRIGKMTLNRNVTNFFAETEQIAFCPANLVPGIDLSDDPLLQGRLFSYLDTQISRLGGVNFHEIPINRPIAQVNNNQRDGLHRMTIDEGVSPYFKNGLQSGQPHPAEKGESAFVSDMHKVTGRVIRNRPESFMDFFSQPSMFYNSLSNVERQHIIDAFRFELGKCKNINIRQAIVDMLNNIDGELSTAVAIGCGATPPQQKNKPASSECSPALSMANQPNCPRGRKVAVLIDSKFNRVCFDSVCNALLEEGAYVDVVAPRQGIIYDDKGGEVVAGETFETTASVLYDAVFIPCGQSAVGLMNNGCALHFVLETFKHYKPIFACGEGVDLLKTSGIKGVSFATNEKDIVEDKGVLTNTSKCTNLDFVGRVIALTGGSRHWERDKIMEVIIA